MILRTKVIFRDGSFCVDLPEYQMVPGSWLPIIADVFHKDGVVPFQGQDMPDISTLTCEVDVPEFLINDAKDGVDFAKVRARYFENSKWNDPQVTPNI